MSMLRAFAGRSARRKLFGAAVAMVGAMVGACGSEEVRESFEPAPEPESALGDASFPALPTGTPDGGGPTRGCSADLQSVIALDGTTAPCPPEQGCLDGRCVAACDAAAGSKGSLGCSYRVATPSFQSEYPAPCFAVFVANAWSKPAKLDVTWGDNTYVLAKFGRIAEPGTPESSWAPVPDTGIPPGKVAVLFLQSASIDTAGSGRTSCPVSPALRAPTGVKTVGRGKAWSVRSDVPVTAYDILPYGGANSFLPSAELLFPTTAWGKNYLAVLPPPLSSTTLGAKAGDQWSQIVAAEDDTTVEIVSTVALPAAGDIAAIAANTPATFKLAAGEFVQWHGRMDMSGSIISADKPVAFTGGDTYLCYGSKTSTGGGCDSGHQQIPPVSALGVEYAVVPYQSRHPVSQAESIRYRIMAAVDGTTLTFDPAIPDAPATLSAGQVVDFETTDAFVVKSQDAGHPFYIAQTMSGCFVGGGITGSLGDEEFVNVLPPAQFLNGYLFFTDPTYATTNLVVTRVKGENGFADVEIDCLGTLTGFTPVGTTGTYEATTVDLRRDGMGACENGPHTVKSSAPVGITVWGLDRFASYAYPAGGSVATINPVVVPAAPR